MKIKKSDKYNSIQNISTKKLVALMLATTFPLTQAACSNNSTEYEDIYASDGVYNYVDGDSNTNIFFANRTSYYEYDDSKLSEIINDIKNIDYDSNNSYFNNFNIYNMPKDEMYEISYRAQLNSFNPSNYTFEYDWFINGEIVEDILYEKIINNTINKNIKIDEELRNAARKIVQEASRNVKYFKENIPNFNFNIAFYNLNNLFVSKNEIFGCISYYESTENVISTNFNYINDDIGFSVTESHEVLHLFLNKSVGGNIICESGASIDLLDNDNSSLAICFMEEYFVQNIACKNLNRLDLNDYVEEKEKINLLCYATNKNENYFEENFICSNQNAFISSFEEELQDFKYVYSTLYALDLSCGYGKFPDDCNTDFFRKECFDFARFNLIKNAYIRIIKDYYLGSITKEDMYVELYNIKMIFNNVEYNYGSTQTNSNYNKLVEKLDSTVNSYINSYKI